MLLSLLNDVAVLGADGLAEFTTITVENAAYSRNPLYRPQDPSTLTLALIGVATLAVYLASSRTLRTRRPAPDSSITAGTAQPLDCDLDQPSRGAA